MKQGVISVESSTGRGDVVSSIMAKLRKLGCTDVDLDGDRGGSYVIFDYKGKKKLPKAITIKVPIKMEELDDEDEEG